VHHRSGAGRLAAYRQTLQLVPTGAAPASLIPVVAVVFVYGLSDVLINEYLLLFVFCITSFLLTRIVLYYFCCFKISCLLYIITQSYCIVICIGNAGGWSDSPAVTDGSTASTFPPQHRSAPVGGQCCPNSVQVTECCHSSWCPTLVCHGFHEITLRFSNI